MHSPLEKNPTKFKGFVTLCLFIWKQSVISANPVHCSPFHSLSHPITTGAQNNILFGGFTQILYIPKNLWILHFRHGQKQRISLSAPEGCSVIGSHCEKNEGLYLSESALVVESDLLSFHDAQPPLKSHSRVTWRTNLSVISYRPETKRKGWRLRFGPISFCI